jgi:hypothetical protein
MPRFRARPREVEAFQWQAELEDVPASFDAYVTPAGKTLLTCYTKQGPVQAAPGDWVILGDDEVYVRKPEEFEKRYELAT